MNDGIPNAISATTIHLALQQLLVTYQSEKAQSQQDDDAWFRAYWESACQTIYDVAAALSIPFGEQPSSPRPYKQRLHQPDSPIPPPADMEPPEDDDAKLKVPLKRLTTQELECLSNEWLTMLECPEDEQDAFRSHLEAIPCTIAMPLEELTNPKLVGSMWILRNFNISRIPKPRPITDKYSFGIQGIEDCIEFEHENLAYAITLWRAGTNPHQINIFLEGALIMSDLAANIISVTKTRLALTKLSKTYRSNQKQQADNEPSREYWDGACQAIADIAAVLNISLEGQPNTPPDSTTNVALSDAQLTEEV